MLKNIYIITSKYNNKDFIKINRYISKNISLYYHNIVISNQVIKHQLSNIKKLSQNKLTDY